MDAQEHPGNTDLLARLRAALPALRASERKVAQFIIDEPTEAQHLTVIELGRRSGASEATVTRLCHALGCEGYTDFKRRLIADLAAARARGTAVAGETYADVQEGDTLPAVVQKVLRMDVQALLDTAAVLDTAQLATAIELLLGARRIECYGVGGSGPVVQDAAYRLLRVGLEASCYTDPHIQIAHAALLDADDVALCISHSGETRDTLDALLVAREAGARTIVITSFPQSPLARAADVKLLTAAVGNRWRGDEIPARIVQLSLVDALCVAVQLRRGATATAAAAKIARGLERKRDGRR
ncbi:MAG TPA: MurR/RpiR family transcriptional regulator [Thermomicrobiales bacterium]|nr:MurR/RpiR family transcriptional regulator [Thermomicrobiales bacterium]